MPAVYAHRRFGEKVLAACRNDEARTAIETYQDLFNIGLQGPDILFYYDPPAPKPLQGRRRRFARRPGRALFEAGAAHVNGRPEGQALLSYLLGFLCHFALDSECHSYIEYEIGRSGHPPCGHRDGAGRRPDGKGRGGLARRKPRGVQSWSARSPPAPSPGWCRRGREQVRQCLAQHEEGEPPADAGRPGAERPGGRGPAPGRQVGGAGRPAHHRPGPARLCRQQRRAGLSVRRGGAGGAGADRRLLRPLSSAARPWAPRFGRTYGPSEELLARYAQG